MTIRDKLMMYIYHKGNELEIEEENIALQTRFAPMDSLDHFEVMNSKIRISAWKEFLMDIYKIIVNCK